MQQTKRRAPFVIFRKSLIQVFCDKFVTRWCEENQVKILHREDETNMSQKPEVPEPEVPEEPYVVYINGGPVENEDETQAPTETTMLETMVEPGDTVIQFEKTEDAGVGRPKGLTFGLRDNPPLSIIIVYAVQVGIP